MRNYLIILLALLSFFVSAQTTFSDQSSNLTYQSANSGAPMGVADMNGDGLDDIIRLDGTTILRLEYQPITGNAFTGYTYGALQGAQWSMCIADADTNGYNDIFTGGGYNGLKLLKADSVGSAYDLTTISILPIFLQGSNFADIDNDGDVDIFACHDDGLSQPYRNDGPGTFTYDQGLINTSSTVPSDNSGNYGSVWTDYDSDGDLDLYISKCRLGVTDPNDGRRLNLLFENDGSGNYTDVAEEVGLLPHGQSWATDFADIDNDGDMDCFVINHDIPCNLYINDGTNHFIDIMATSGMAATLATAGNGIQVKFVDFDNDTYVDLLYSSNGSNHLLFRNNGNQTFSVVNGWIPTDDRIHSFATGDLNDDGFIDFIAGFGNGYNTPNDQISDKLFMNDGNQNNFLKVRLEGNPSNKNGVGARLELYGSWGKQVREIRAGESYGITTSLTTHFGLGDATAIDSLIVKWPSGYIDQINQPDIDQTLIVVEASNCIAVADFNADVNGLVVNFSDQSSLGANTWFWTFGDGNMTLGQNPQHTYAQMGVYEVCLLISGDCGTTEICKDVVVDCSTPTADFFASSGVLEVSFFSVISGTATSIVWDFGDGTGLAGNPNPQHTYSTPGLYTVCLDVGSPCGNVVVCHDIAVACTPPSVGFSAQVNQLTMIFTDESGDDVTQWFWDFGDGTTSSLQNPTHTFPSSGTYIICQTVTSDCGSNSVCLQVTLNCTPPSVSFQAQINQLTVAFTDNSGADVTDWLWDFDDGTTSTEENPTHTFPGPGTYNVCLTVTSACSSSTVCLSMTLNCTPPTAGFQAQINQLTVDFTENASPDVTDWLWNFDDGTAATGENPTHTFPGPGTYNVCLTVTSPCGSNTVCLPITVNCAPPSVGFQAQTNNLTTTFTSTSGPDVTQWLWDFGDGNSSILENPDHTYFAPGIYTVCLTGTSVCGSVQVCLPVSVNCSTPAAGFQAQVDQLTVSFVDTSDPAVTQWLWDFGDGNTSDLQNPTHTYAAPGTYTACLTITSSCGTNQVCLPVTVSCTAPAAGFGAQVSQLTVTLTDTSSPDVTQWLWEFNDGTSSTEQNPTHSYSTAGTYLVCLTATSVCGSTQICLPVTVTCTPPSAGFDVQINELTVDLTDNSSADVEQWFWSFGDGNTSTLENPSHTYTTPGTYTICLTATSSCSSTQLCLNITVNCTTPSADFIIQNSLSTVTLTDNSSGGVDQWSWNFGDGTNSTEQNPTHTYTASGTYTICLVITSDCGTDQACQSVVIDCPAPNAGFTAQATNFTVNFADISGNQPDSWFWDFGDGTNSTQQNPLHIYAQTGNYTVCLTVTNACGQNTSCQEITITCPAPQAIFSTQTDGFTANFNDLSSNQPTNWSWNFGDGNTSVDQNPTHTYAVEGTYTVCLTVTNNCGENSYCEPITVTCAAPDAAFSVQNTNLTADFTDDSGNQPASWQWNFGDGNTSTTQNPIHNYVVPGSYTVCLTVTNSCGSDQNCQQVVITCEVPQAGFMYQSDELIINFLDFSSGQPTSWLWDFGDGNTSASQNPSNTYSLPGTYMACLTASSACGSNQACQQIVISCSPPQAGFTFQNSDLTANFTDNSTNQPTSWLWNFGDGTTSTLQNPSNTYDLPGTYTVCLTATSICGNTQFCQEVTTNCPPPAVGFELQINELQVSFTDDSGDDVTQWLWDFGDGNSSVDENPVHDYAIPGSYTVCLTATSDCGSSQICLTATINCGLPSVGFNTQINQLSLSFTDNSDDDVTSWLWDFGDGNTSTTQHPAHTYAAPGTYTVCLTGISICGSTQNCQTITVSCGVPVAGFNTSSDQLTVNFTDNSGNEVTQWLWDFGDGNSSTEENPSHTFTNAGTYMVCLTVTSICGSDQFCQNITVDCPAPQAEFNFETAELEVDFIDNSTNAPTQWFWDFGDGNFSTDQNPSHGYTSPGAYTVCLTALSECGSAQSCQQLIVTCTAPESGFAVQTFNLTATLTDNSGNNPAQWLWDFGDGTTSDLPNPVHEYVASGTYMVCLTVSSTCGNSQSCQTIAVSCLPPEAIFSINGSGLDQVFQDVSTNNPESWLWDFDDGMISGEQNPFHTFAEMGSYNICLTVSNACGTDTECHLVFLTTATNEPELALDIQLTPNPASSYIQLNFDIESPVLANLYLTDTKGRKVAQWEALWIGGINEQKRLDVADLADGIYFVVIETADGVVVKRFVRM